MSHIVLGYDGSDFSVRALEWAIEEAELRRLPLLLAHAWQWPYGQAIEEAKGHLRKAAEHVLSHGAECARASSSGVRVDTDLYEGSAARRLVGLSGGAALVVVGSRGLSALPRAVVGSVAGYVAAHADCPVIVVRGPGPGPARTGPIVVADRAPGPAVLEFAFGEAALRQVRLTTSADLAGWAELYPGVRIGPGDEPATLMVTGRRQGTRFGAAGFLLQHAPCPVAVVAEP
ncbi:universal stress protein [Nonomuraea jiangxiensis]|uniref:Nucleotide-binding universal stress protein, UspA family n=1 Tax=Nonomuraea jiangxiensis TaxID=633440 RepID=A0A1G8ENS3_9ACTN|nr:universal stress protein [Nonomuraea jiangxiensis]SDH71339.1 Nucleotide-binding universal stress protein, UspA family [Nonomuraea jiangxiensis]